MRVGTVKRKSELAFDHIIVSYLFCLVCEEYANVYLNFYGPLGSGDAMGKLAQHGFREVLEGSYAAHLFQTVVARRLD